MVPFNQIALPIETRRTYVTTMTFEFLLDIVTIPEDVIEDNKGFWLFDERLDNSFLIDVYAHNTMFSDIEFEAKGKTYEGAGILEFDGTEQFLPADCLPALCAIKERIKSDKNLAGKKATVILRKGEVRHLYNDTETTETTTMEKKDNPLFNLMLASIISSDTIYDAATAEKSLDRLRKLYAQDRWSEEEKKMIQDCISIAERDLNMYREQENSDRADINLNLFNNGQDNNKD